MALTESQLIASVNKKIHNAKAKLGGDSEMRRILNEAGRKLRARVDLVGLKRYSTPFFHYSKIYEYAAPVDISYDKVIEVVDERDIELITETTNPKEFFTNRNPNYSRGSERDFVDFNNPLGLKVDAVAAIEMENASPYTLLRTRYSQSTSMLHSCDGYDANGTWTASSDATGVRTDTSAYKESMGSVAFDSSGGATTVIVTNSDMSAVDLSTYDDIGAGFLWVYLPSVPTSMTLKWGSDASNYFSKTVTVRQNGLAFRIGWNLVAFDWVSATATGTAVTTAIDYAQLTITNPSSVANYAYRIDALMFAKGRHMSIKYYSRYMVTDTDDNSRKADFEDGNDSSILREDESDLLIEQAAIIALQELREFDEADDREERYYKPMLEEYKLKNASQKEPRSFTYHNL
jgi:hypothetical protein